MKAGMSIEQLSSELKKQAAFQEDISTPSRKINMVMQHETVQRKAVEEEAEDDNPLTELLSKVDLVATESAIEAAFTVDSDIPYSSPNPMRPHLNIEGKGTYLPNAVAHAQIAAKCGIPKAYYDRMMEQHPGLLTNNVNTWLWDCDDRRLVRTIGPIARAVLSNRYRRLDNLPLIQSVIDQIIDLGVRIEDIVSCSVTDRKMYLKVLSPRLKADVEVGDTVQAGLVLTNSEVGHGSVSVQPLIYRLSCDNGAIMQDTSLRKHHLGRALGDGDEAYQLFTDETLKKDDDAFFAKVRDVVRGTLTEELFDLEVEKLRAANGQQVEAKIPDAVEVLSKKYSLTEAEGSSVLDNFITGKNFSRWGLANAVTLMSADVKGYDRATELERIGGQIIEMPDSSWKEIAAAG